MEATTIRTSNLSPRSMPARMTCAQTALDETYDGPQYYPRALDARATLPTALALLLRAPPSLDYAAMACVLIADDSKLVRDTLRSMFIEEGFDVCEAGNGNEAVEEAKKLRPDIVVLDFLMLEDMEGVQTTYAIRQFAPKAKIIFYSVCDFPEMVAAVRVMGASAFVPKSSPHELLLAVRSLIAGENVMIGAQIVS